MLLQKMSILLVIPNNKVFDKSYLNDNEVYFVKLNLAQQSIYDIIFSFCYRSSSVR